MKKRQQKILDLLNDPDYDMNAKALFINDEQEQDLKHTRWFYNSFLLIILIIVLCS